MCESTCSQAVRVAFLEEVTQGGKQSRRCPRAVSSDETCGAIDRGPQSGDCGELGVAHWSRCVLLVSGDPLIGSDV